MPRKDRESYLAYQRAYRLKLGMKPRVPRQPVTCVTCGRIIGKNSTKYCGQRCQWDTQYREYIRRWQAGEIAGGNVAMVSRTIRRYLIEQGGEQCSLCGWHERHPITGRVPLEIDHVNGNYADNRSANLRLLCPNCHALTPTYKALNRGNGRPYAIVRRLL